jgi:aryl-alcohol dehydrogenase-like predicted oxidoreductase
MRKLGKSGLEVSAIGLGAMGMSGMYGPTDDARSEATIRHALDLGVNFIDTADFYGSGHNEMLIGRAIEGRRDEVILSVKFGALRTPDGGWGGHEARPVAMRNYLAYSLKRLRVDHIDLYTPSRVDRTVPIEEVVGAMAEMVEKGYIRHIGLSEAGPDEIRRANAVHPIAALQIEYSLWTRDIEAEVLPATRELGIATVAYSPLSRGFLSGQIRSPQDFAPGDFRRNTPRFQGENFARNLALVDAVRELTAKKGATPAQLAIAWVLSRGEDVIPIPGTRDPKRLEENLGALDVRLTPEDLRALDEVSPAGAVAGDRYNAYQMDAVYTPSR